MKLKSLKLPEATVEIPGGGNITVRGLSLIAIESIVRQYKAKLSAFFETVQEEGEIDSMANVAMSLLHSAPEVVAKVIACAAGEDDEETIAVLLQTPAPFQLEALEKIGELTFGTSGPKKLLETVIRMAEGASRLMDVLKS